ncbi:hypothetical protein, partial [Burkholderia ubonensis]|uniref:hypothetical protein n=1 Tax=Burkholderia ubonensis TaxID=101571 RepID=UPI000AA0FDB1
MIGNERIDHVLTDADIQNGKASIFYTGNDIGLLGAALVDQAGNSSGYRTGIYGGADFDDVPVGTSIPNGGSLLSGDIKVTGISGRAIVERHNTTEFTYNSLHIYEGEYDFSLQGTAAKRVSFNVGHTDQGSSRAEFYDENGDIIEVVNFPYGVANLEYENLEGKLIYGFKVYINDSLGVLIDSITIEGFESDVVSPVIQEIGGQGGAFYGGSSDDVFLAGESEVFEDAGTSVSGAGGTDTLKLTTADQVLDLTQVGEKLSSIEVIDLTGTGNNTLKLSLDDVLANGAVDLFHDSATDTVQMMVKGDAGDVVDLEGLLGGGDPGEWSQQAGKVTIEGVEYHVYVHSSLQAELLVQDGVTTHLPA